jgi:hypothetical protein
VKPAMTSAPSTRDTISLKELQEKGLFFIFLFLKFKKKKKSKILKEIEQD